MSPILGIYASQISGHLVTDNYSSIATQTVGSGGASSITFSSIPSTYTHLQIRIAAQTNRGTYGIDDLKIFINSDTGNNYSFHDLWGDGGTAGAASATSAGRIETYRTLGTTAGGSFGVSILDILDYANTNKYKTTRLLGGVDLNGTLAGYGGAVDLNSGLWMNTAVVNTLTFSPAAGTAFTQYSSFALYGVR